MKIKCKATRGYNITEGKEYIAIELIPQLITPNFTFPRYVRFVDDNGKSATAHAWRFDTLEGQLLEDYIKDNVPDEKDIK